MHIGVCRAESGEGGVSVLQRLFAKTFAHTSKNPAQKVSPKMALIRTKPRALQPIRRKSSFHKQLRLWEVRATV